jgi:hypothetical protein
MNSGGRSSETLSHPIDMNNNHNLVSRIKEEHGLRVFEIDAEETIWTNEG